MVDRGPVWLQEMRNTGGLTRLIWGPDGWLIGATSLNYQLGKLWMYLSSIALRRSTSKAAARPSISIVAKGS